MSTEERKRIEDQELLRQVEHAHQPKCNQEKVRQAAQKIMEDEMAKKLEHMAKNPIALAAKVNKRANS